MSTKRAYKKRFYPTPEQALLLAQSFGCARFVYNNTLKFRTDAYYNDGKSISHSCQSIRLTKAAFSMKNGQIYIAKSKTHLNIRWSRPLSSDPSSITISKDLQYARRATNGFRSMDVALQYRANSSG